MTSGRKCFRLQTLCKSLGRASVSEMLLIFFLLLIDWFCLFVSFSILWPFSNFVSQWVPLFFLGNMAAYVTVSARALVARLFQSDHSSGTSLESPALPGTCLCVLPFEGLVNQQEVCSPVTRAVSWRVFMRESLMWVLTLSFSMRCSRGGPCHHWQSMLSQISNN